MKVSKQVIFQNSNQTQAGNWLPTWISPPPSPSWIRIYSVFYLDQEASLKEMVILYVQRGFPFTGKQLCTLAYEMATRDKKRGFSSVKMTAGRCWLKGFRKCGARCQLISRLPEQCQWMQPRSAIFSTNTKNGWRIGDWNTCQTASGIWTNVEWEMSLSPQQLSEWLESEVFKLWVARSPQILQSCLTSALERWQCLPLWFSKQSGLNQTGVKQPQLGTWSKDLQVDTSIENFKLVFVVDIASDRGLNCSNSCQEADRDCCLPRTGRRWRGEGGMR